MGVKDAVSLMQKRELSTKFHILHASSDSGNQQPALELWAILFVQQDLRIFFPLQRSKSSNRDALSRNIRNRSELFSVRFWSLVFMWDV